MEQALNILIFGFFRIVSISIHVGECYACTLPPRLRLRLRLRFAVEAEREGSSEGAAES
jgi:hypothetical protein